MKETFLKSVFYRTIYVLWWIRCCEMSLVENLRRNENETECMSELVSRKLLSDNQFTASSYYQKKTIFQPRMARLLDIHSQSSSSDGRAWCPETEVHRELTEWLEVDLGRMTILKALYTMGRGDGNFKKFTPEIVIRYQRSESSKWITYRDSHNKTVIEINTDSRTKLRTSLRTIVARKIRIYPVDTKTGPKSVCLKIAFLGCYFDDEIVSYEVPEGDHGVINHNQISLKDISYDGSKGNVLQNGLGLLTDNVFLKSSVNMDDYINRGYSSLFIGWKCNKERQQSPISLRFNFDQERIFSEMSIYYVTNVNYDMILTLPLVISIGYDNDTHRNMYNTTLDSISSPYVATIPIHQIKGTQCTLNISCGLSNWIALSEIQIKSTKSPVIRKEILKFNQNITITMKKVNPVSDGTGNTLGTNYVYFLLAIGLAVILVLVLLSFMAFLFYKMKRLKQYKVNKKLQFVATCNKANFYNPSSRTVFTMQSKRSSVTSMSRPNYYPEPTAPVSAVYGGSQPSDGVYASWPNTDDDADTAIVDKEEESCLLVTDSLDTKNVSKDYAVYQPGVEYAHGSRPASIIVPTVSCISEKIPLPSLHLKKAPSYDLLKSNTMTPYRNFHNVVSFQHLSNYRGLCGDVDFRYQSLPVRPDNQALDSDIKIISTSSMVFVQPWTRGQYGAIDIVNVSIDHNETVQYFMKKIRNDTPSSLRSSFIMDLKVLSSLNMSNVALLVAIVVDCDLIHTNISSVIRSGKFSLLVEHSGGYNLKGFLRNLNYPQQTQKYKTATLPLQSQYPISIPSMLSIIGQISGGLRHLEELDLTHRDVGCRNCMIDSRKQIKLYPGGYVTAQPFEDYCSVDIQNSSINFPLRWLSPESIFKGLFTSKSDVWSFGVTMWEVFTMCSIMPYPSLANEALMELMTNQETAPRLPCPQNCPREMYELMSQCWSWEPSKRPSFMDIDPLLQMKVKVVMTNTTQLLLPNPPPAIVTVDNPLI